MHFSQTDLIIIVSTFIILIVVLMMITVYGIFIKKKSELLLIQQKKQAIFEQERALSKVEIQDQTLKYIGQELHDDLGQKLSVARLMTNKISYDPDADSKQIAEEINLLIGECLQDIRNLSKAFIVPPTVHFDLMESLEKEIFRIKRLGLLEVAYHIGPHTLTVNPEHGLILFRILQECITNVIKHSRSRSIELVIEDHQKFIKFMVTDEGIGYKNVRNSGGTGLNNMISRAKIINAEFKIHSVENKGTRVVLIYKKQL